MLGFKLIYVSKRGPAGVSPGLVVARDCGVEVSYSVREEKIWQWCCFQWDVNAMMLKLFKTFKAYLFDIFCSVSSLSVSCQLLTPEDFICYHHTFGCEHERSTHWGLNKTDTILQATFQINFLGWKYCISIQILLKFVQEGPIDKQ